MSSIFVDRILMWYRRLEKEEGQNDFLENVTDKTRKGEISLAEMEAHSWNMS